MDEPTIPQVAAFEIQLPSFEGPLDLLLHLIKRHELDVLDLPIAFVTSRYLDYLQMMQELDLDVASEYLLMAATLAHIKSKMLLPTVPNDTLEEQEEAYQADPRAELIRRLLEYQKYKEAAAHLGSRPLSGRDVFQRGLSAPEAQGPAPLAAIDLYKLLDAFQAILKRVHGRVALEVTAESITIQERISQLADVLRVKRSCVFDELFESARTRYEVIVTFLALLEMTKLRMTRIYQADPNSALHVQYALLDADSPTIPPDALTADARTAAEFSSEAAIGEELALAGAALEVAEATADELNAWADESAEPMTDEGDAHVDESAQPMADEREAHVDESAQPMIAEREAEESADPMADDHQQRDWPETNQELSANAAIEAGSAVEWQALSPEFATSAAIEHEAPADLPELPRDQPAIFLADELDLQPSAADESEWIEPAATDDATPIDADVPETEESKA